MRKFIFKSVFFIGLTSAIIGCGVLFTNIYVTEKAEFNLNQNSKYIILGHSHSECAYNDSLINDFSNLSQSGESYFYTYQKLKMILGQNIHIKAVFIELSNNQIIDQMNEWIWGDKYLSHYYSTYSPFMTLADNKLIAEHNIFGLLNVLPVSFKNNFLNIFTNNLNYSNKIGSYNYLVRDKTDSLLSADDYLKDSIDYQKGVSIRNIEYLDKIIDYCLKSGKKVYLLRSPLHPKYVGYKNESIFKGIISSKYSKIDFFDFSKFPLLNSEFGDLDHLNYRGAKIYSIWFNKLIVEGLLTQKNKQDFIDRRMPKPL